MDDATVTLRPATLDDAELFERWCREPHVIAATTDDAAAPRAFEGAIWTHELASQSAVSRYVVAEVDGRPIGVMQIVDPHLEPEHYWAAIGDQDYTPVIYVQDQGVVFNAPVVAYGNTDAELDFCNGAVDHTKVHDKVTAICPKDQTVTLSLTQGFSFGKPVLYLSTDASDPLPAALEQANYAPALKNTKVGGDDSAFSPVERLFAFTNGPGSVGNHQRLSLTGQRGISDPRPRAARIHHRPGKRKVGINGHHRELPDRAPVPVTTVVRWRPRLRPRRRCLARRCAHSSSESCSFESIEPSPPLSTSTSIGMPLPAHCW